MVRDSVEQNSFHSCKRRLTWQKTAAVWYNAVDACRGFIAYGTREGFV